ncbi:MAG: DUF6531 domain-containing protein [Steroidobacteraceae bacterium]
MHRRAHSSDIDFDPDLRRRESCLHDRPRRSDVARAACTTVPAAPTYRCVGGLCVGGCPSVGSIASFKACSENNYNNVPVRGSLTLQSLFGTLTFDYENDAFTATSESVELRWTSQRNGDYNTTLGLATPGTDCPQTERNLGPKMCPGNGGPVMGEPVNSSTGNQYENELDYEERGSFPLSFHRHYNSTAAGDNTIGVRWSRSFDRLLIRPNSAEVKLYRDDGEVLYFQQCGALWCAVVDETGALTQTTDSSGHTVGWQYVDTNDVVEQYNGAGQLISEISRSGLAHTLAYDTAGRLSTVTDSFGHQLGIAYDSSGRIHQLIEPAGANVTYSYDGAGNLSTVS